MNDAPDPKVLEHREFLGLVKEFSEKLRNACDAYHTRRTNWSRNLMLGCQATAIGATLFFLFVVKLNKDDFRVDWHDDGSRIILEIALLVILVAALYLLGEAIPGGYLSLAIRASAVDGRA